MTSQPIKAERAGKGAEEPPAAPPATGASGAASAAQRLYIYYRVAEADWPAALAAAQALRTALLAAHPGLIAELLRRPGQQGGHITLMETYARPNGVDNALAGLIEQRAAAALAPWLQGPRHVEHFEALASSGC